MIALKEEWDDFFLYASLLIGSNNLQQWPITWILSILFYINFIKKENLAQVLTCEFCEISKNTFFTEHLRTTASDSTDSNEVTEQSHKVHNSYSIPIWIIDICSLLLKRKNKNILNVKKVFAKKYKMSGVIPGAKFHGPNKVIATTIFIIFWDFLMF